MADKFISLAALAAVVGLAETATESDVITKLKERLTPPQLPDLKPLSASVEGFETRLKKVEDANTKAIATLSATIDGKVVTLNAEDVVKLHNRVEALSATLTATATKAEESERASLIEQATNDGKLIPLSVDTLKTLPLPALKELVGKLPANAVPLSVRGKSPTGKTTSDKTGLAKAIELHQAGL